MGIPASEVTAMRAVSDGYLTDTCTIQRATVTQDAMGGVITPFATLASGVACRLDEPKSGDNEATLDMEVGAAIGRIMHFVYSQDVTIKDRIVYGGLTYEVAQVLEAATWLISRRVICKRIE